MRNAINNTTNVTAVAIVNRSVATALVGVDASRMDSLRHLRLYHAAPAMHRWAHFEAARKQPAGKQKPAMGMPGWSLSSDLSRPFARHKILCLFQGRLPCAAVSH